MLAQYQKYAAKHKIITVVKAVQKIQSKFKFRFVTRQAKIAALSKYWDKLYLNMKKQAKEYQDKEMIELLKLIKKVSDQVKIEAIKGYLMKCQDLWVLAFFQWRNMYSSTISFNQPLVEAMAQCQITKIYSSNVNSVASKDTQFYGKLPSNLS